jgi:hypothetical protein
MWPSYKPTILSFTPLRLEDSFVKAVTDIRLPRAINGVLEVWCVCLSSSHVELAIHKS